MALRAGRSAAREFARRRPAVCGFAARYGLSAATFSAGGDTRVARAARAARSLVLDVAGSLAAAGGTDPGPGPSRYAALRRAAGVRTADAVAEFAAAVSPAVAPEKTAAAAGAFAAACNELIDAYDDVVFSAASEPRPAFLDTFRDHCGGLVSVAVGAAIGAARTLNPAAAARELAAAVAFGWQDEVRDAQGKWSRAGGGSAGNEKSAEREKSARPVDAPPERIRSLIEAKPDPANLPARDQLPDLPPPPAAGSHPVAIREWAHKVSNHPYVKEAERLVQAARDAGATTGNLHWDPDAAGGKGDFTDARKKVHAEIAGHVLNPAAAARPGERPQVSFVLGPPGSGKTSMGRPAARAAMGLPQDRTTTLDPDEVKMSLPEYRGWNAALVHDESAEVFDRLLEKAVADRHHVVFDTTGRSEEFMKGMLDKFAKAGYDAHLVHTHLSGEESARRAVGRFVGQAFKDSPDPEKRGRYVPVGFIAEHIDGHPQRVYDKLREDPRVKSWVSYDANDLASGKIISSGTRTSADQTDEKDAKSAA
jgi:adenylate kinase family enzyme